MPLDSTFNLKETELTGYKIYILLKYREEMACFNTRNTYSREELQNRSIEQLLLEKLRLVEEEVRLELQIREIHGEIEKIKAGDEHEHEREDERKRDREREHQRQCRRRRRRGYPSAARDPDPENGEWIDIDDDDDDHTHPHPQAHARYSNNEYYNPSACLPCKRFCSFIHVSPPIFLVMFILGILGMIWLTHHMYLFLGLLLICGLMCVIFGFTSGPNAMH